MRIAVYLPLLFSLALAGLSPILARRLPPATATRILTGAAALAAMASSWGLTLLSVSAAGWLPELPRQAHISRIAWISRDPAPVWVGMLATLALVIGLRRILKLRQRQRQQTRAAAAVCAESRDSELVVMQEDRPRAFVVASGAGGRIVVSEGMLRLLDARERRVLFAHERAHLTSHHHRYRQLSDAAVALNPLLRRVRDDVAYTCERWADESACQAVGDRHLAAQALSRAALATLSSSGATLAFERLDVTHRVAALHRPAPARGSGLTLSCILIAMLIAAAAASGDATFALARFLASVVPSIHDLAQATGL